MRLRKKYMNLRKSSVIFKKKNMSFKTYLNFKKFLHNLCETLYSRRRNIRILNFFQPYRAIEKYNRLRKGVELINLQKKQNIRNKLDLILKYMNLRKSSVIFKKKNMSIKTYLKFQEFKSELRMIPYLRNKYMNLKKSSVIFKKKNMSFKTYLKFKNFKLEIRDRSVIFNFKPNPIKSTFLLKSF